jgi:NADH:ubiquinone oxidoreductase subunit 4 (subunit M)
MVLAGTGIVWSAIYSIWLYNRLIFGTLKIKYISNFLDLNTIEFMILLILTCAVILWGVNSTILTSLTALNIKYILLSSVFK